MKELADKTVVSDRSYYYLLDFLDGNKMVMKKATGKDSLCDLNIDEFRKLFKHATNFDYFVMKGNL